MSTWRIELPKDCNAFDFETITDVVLRLSYTARDGGARLAAAARQAVVVPQQDGRQRLFSAKHEFSDEWYRFLHPDSAAETQGLPLDFSSVRFPFQFRGKPVLVTGARVFLKLREGTAYPGSGAPLTVLVTPAGGLAPVSGVLQAVPTVLAEMPFVVLDFSPSEKPGQWLLELREADLAKVDPALRTAIVSAGGKTLHRLRSELVEDIIVVLEYTA